jgi:predicted phosphoribosyltransferase
VILVDDGLASGFTMQTAVAAVRGSGAAVLIVAVPTAHLDAARTVAAAVTLLVCPNLRGARPYAVAAAYRHWSDVAEDEVDRLLGGGLRAGADEPDAWG